MTTVEKRKIQEAVDNCIKYDLFTEMEAEKIIQICYAAINRAVRAAEEGER